MPRTASETGRAQSRRDIQDISDKHMLKETTSPANLSRTFDDGSWLEETDLPVEAPLMPSPPHQSASELRDRQPYQGRNICGPLVAESNLIFGALHAGRPLGEVRAAALSGELLRQPSYQARRRFWHALHGRYITHRVTWVIEDLVATVGAHPGSPEAIGLLYLHFVLRDRLTFDVFTGPVWDSWQEGQRTLARHDMLGFIERVAPEMNATWSQSSRIKLATSLLTALRDYGVARGIQTKVLQRPVVPSQVVLHLLRILIEEGSRGAELLADRTWRLFLMTPEDVAGQLLTLAQGRVIHFERAGSTVVLETPWGTS